MPSQSRHMTDLLLAVEKLFFSKSTFALLPFRFPRLKTPQKQHVRGQLPAAWGRMAGRSFSVRPNVKSWAQTRLERRRAKFSPKLLNVPCVEQNNNFGINLLPYLMKFCFKSASHESLGEMAVRRVTTKEKLWLFTREETPEKLAFVIFPSFFSYSKTSKWGERKWEGKSGLQQIFWEEKLKTMPEVSKVTQRRSTLENMQWKDLFLLIFEISQQNFSNVFPLLCPVAAAAAASCWLTWRSSRALKFFHYVFEDFQKCWKLNGPAVSLLVGGTEFTFLNRNDFCSAFF